jgi:uncharacterized protein
MRRSLCRRWRSSELRWFAAAALLLLAACGKPDLVEDEAGLLSEAEQDRIAEFHGLLEEDHGIDYRVATVRDVSDIERAAVERFARLRIGGEGNGGRGLLLLVDPGGKRVRLEVGRALEGSFTDAFVTYVENRQMAPFFAAGRVADGILATTELIVQRAIEARASGDPLAGKGKALSAGGGATAAIAPGQSGLKTDGDDRRSAGATPEATLAAYFELMRERDGAPDHGLYTPETQAMLRRWVMTPAQMDTILRAYRRCEAEPAKVDASGRLAVIRYRINDRECSPWFFTKSAEGWQLDLIAMQQAIRFGRGNEWHLAPGADQTYAFAFSDWRFDAQGFPQSGG